MIRLLVLLFLLLVQLSESPEVGRQIDPPSEDAVVEVEVDGAAVELVAVEPGVEEAVDRARQRDHGAHKVAGRTRHPTGPGAEAPRGQAVLELKLMGMMMCKA